MKPRNKTQAVTKSLKKIMVPMFKFDDYVQIIASDGNPRIKGLGEKPAEFLDNQRFFLDFYRLGKEVILLSRSHELRINDSSEEYNQLAFDWIRKNGFPSLQSQYSFECTKENENTFTPTHFYTIAAWFCKFIEEAYKLDCDKKEDQSRERISKSIGNPTTQFWIMNIGDRLGYMMEIGGGIYPFIEYSDTLLSYSIEYRASSHLSAACAQIAMKLADGHNLTRKCKECDALFIFEGKEQFCSDLCRSKMRNFQCMKVRQKPVELRDPRKRRTKRDVK